MDSKKKLAFAIAKFLKDEWNAKQQEDESLEVAVQCVESAFGVSLEDNTLDVGITLPTIFEAVLKKIEEERPPVTDEVKAEAESWKNKGNELIKSEKFSDALECYNKAIQLDSRNPVYYCNRAAAHCRLNNHDLTINDCLTAIQLEPTYGKAYGRLGLAYGAKKMYTQSIESYKKALEFEPDNELYKENLKMTEEQCRAERSRPSASSLGDLTFGNERVMSMATQMLEDPSMQAMLNNLMSGDINPGGGGMDNLLQTGMQLAQMMQSSNPELVEQLRQQFGRGGNPPAAPQN